MSIFEGLHPRLRQRPPIGPFSISAVSKPSAAAAEATVLPVPPPKTITSKSTVVVKR
jgi:hypothetical protein